MRALRDRVGPAVPGLVVAFALGAASSALGPALRVPPLLAAVAVGAIGGAACRGSSVLAPGLDVVTKRVLRVGVVLLGFRLAVGDILSLGGGGLAVVVGLVVVSFVVTRRLGAALGLAPELSLLIACGFSICGASAIAAVAAGGRAKEEEVAYGITLVTLCGTGAMLLLPLLREPLGLSAIDFGRWAGASIHDVAQVVAASSSAGRVGLESGVVVKLARVLLLLPLVVSVSARRRALGRDRERVPVPLFALGFLVAAGVRSSGMVPREMVHAAGSVAAYAFAVGLVGVGFAIDPARFRDVGWRPLLVGVSSTAFITCTALVVVAAL